MRLCGREDEDGGGGRRYAVEKMVSVRVRGCVIERAMLRVFGRVGEGEGDGEGDDMQSRG